MAALLALTAAAAYGAGDFLGGVAARRVPATAVVLWSHVVGLAAMVLAAPLLGGQPTERALLVGALAGVAGSVGVALFYQALSIGTMSVVAPVTALLSAVVPVFAGIATGERPEPVALAGIALALVAVGLVSRRTTSRPEADAISFVTAGWGSRPRRRRWLAGPVGRRTDGSLGPSGSPLALALAAGLGFGLFFVILDATGDGVGIWPLVGARTASVTLFGTLGLTRVIAATPPRRGVAGAALGAGLLDAAANVFYVLALAHGLLSVVSVLTTLYPAGTVLLARYVLGERMSSVQQAGLAFAGFAAVLIAA